MSGLPPKPHNTTRCPICKKVAVARFRPFCSQRCADLDLGRWLKGSYSIPSEEPLDPDADDSTGQLPHPDRDG